MRGIITHIYNALLVPKSYDEDSRRREFILNVLVIGSIVLVLISGFLIVKMSISLGGEYHGISIGIFIVTIFGFIGLHKLSRRGYHALASEFLIIFYLIGAGYGAYHWGPDLPAALLSFALVIIMASILLGTFRGFLTAICIGIFIAVLGYKEYHNGLLPESHWKLQVFDSTDAIEYSILLLLIMVISWLSNREIEKSLSRARHSEQQLKEQRDNLEVVVEQRTRELRESQAQRVGQVYRFAEFGKLASGFFHDIMTPLTAMSLHVDQLRKSDIKKSETTSVELDNVLIAARRMEHFIGSAKKQLESQDIPETFSLNSVIAEVIEVLAYKIHKSGALVEFHGDQEMQHFGNALIFHQVMLNLISNALDACAIKRSRISAEAPLRVDISLDMREGNIIVVVDDEGCGIDSDIVNKIFDPFFTTKHKNNGIGIGLSLTKEFVEKKFNGTLSVVSKKGMGATFTVQFPVVHA